MNEFSTLMNTLETALSLKRGHGSETEGKFVAWLIKQVTPSMIDGGGNIHVELGSSRTMFTAHTDTVHRKEGVNGIRKTDSHWYADGDALGADDGCGIALMLHMIAAGVPGRYVFFRGEECGGVGSGWLAENMPDLLSKYDRAIAFDRAGLGDVITHQAGGRCCSDLFANALADAMNVDGLMYLPDSTGVYTDTAEFIRDIPECTNLSVGYASQHGPKEELNLRHFLAVAAVVTKISWEALPTSRDPKVKATAKPALYGNVRALAGWNDPLFDEEDDFAYSAADADAQTLDATAAIEAALDFDDFRLLIDLIAEAIYPDDVDLARKHIKTRYITHEMLERALADLDIMPVEEVMLELFDRIPATA